MSRRVVYLVPHTHWDREWYLPFQTFRLRLVRLVDALLDRLEREPELVFTLDGQLATVDDYLELRPENEERIRRLVEDGRLAIGPWQILMDEFLVSGETIVRNLERGLARAAELGGAMRVGYLPDMFGHVAQMPQLLRRAGIDVAVVWRGVPAAIDRHSFLWRSPDGSEVRAEFLPGGYGNAAYVLADPDRLAEELAALDEALRPFFGDDPLLALVGTDHMETPPELVGAVARANDGGARVELATLERYLTRVRGSEPQSAAWEGELRSAARSNLLPGVVSARIDLKAACARAERSLARYAEPLLALHGAEWPERELALAWGRVIDNSAHDSICGCSADPVSAQVLVRFAEAEQIGDALTAEALAAVRGRAGGGAAVVVNPSPVRRAGLVEVDVGAPDEWEDVALELPDGTRAGTQEAGRNVPLVYSTELLGRELPTVFRRLHGRELFGKRLNALVVGAPARRLTLEVDDEDDPLWLDVGALKRNVEVAGLEAPEEAWDVRIVARPRRRLLASVAPPALGWTAVRPVRGAGTVAGAVRAGERVLSGDGIELHVAADGTLELDAGGVSLRGLGRLVDGGDAGDSYNYAPPVEDAIVDAPDSVDVEVRAAGPVRAALAVTRAYRWPLSSGADTRTRETAVAEVETLVELRAGEPFVRLRFSGVNPSRDHRLRFHLPLPAAASSSSAAGQFCVVERGVEVEAGYGEEPLPTFPADGFVDAGRLAVLTEHPLEYELVESGRELALTLLRSIGLISRNDNRYREDPAGPEVPIPDAQRLGPWSVSLALFPHPGSWPAADVHAQAERFRHELLVVPGSGGDGELREQTGLELSGAGVVLGSLRRRDDELELRLSHEHPDRGVAVLGPGLAGAREVDLVGAPVGDLPLEDGTLRLDVGPWEIRTLRVRLR